MAFNKTVSLSFLLLTLCFITRSTHAMNKANSAVQEALAMVRMQQQPVIIIERPSTPLNPGNNSHRPFINFLQTKDGRPVTADDVFNYIGFYPTR